MSSSSNKQPNRKILLLHGDRQTGELLLGRISSLKRKLLKPRTYGDADTIDSNPSLDHRIEIVAPDGPFRWIADPSVHHISNQDENGKSNGEDLLRTWWYRKGDVYEGLEQSLEMLHGLWLSDPGFEGILGFSRGGRLTHLIAMLHEASGGLYFPNLKYVICASAYGHVSLPCNFPPKSDGIQWKAFSSTVPLKTKSLHVMGIQDRLIPLEASRALLPSYVDPVVHEFDGGHHVPMRAADVRAMLKFIDSSSVWTSAPTEGKQDSQISKPPSQKDATPDEEHSQLQIDECESMSLIFPEEFELLSLTKNGDKSIVAGETQYQYPISYIIQLKPPPDQLEEDNAVLWPKNKIALKVEYTNDYPDKLPIFSLQHEMNLLEFKLAQEKACLDAVKAAAEAEAGMPCIMSCIYAARAFFESGGLQSSSEMVEKDGHVETDDNDEVLDEKHINGSCIRSSSRERIEQCKREGLQISYDLAGYSSTFINKVNDESHDISESNESFNSGKGGSWKYTIGLVGKPSAGKVSC